MRKEKKKSIISTKKKGKQAIREKGRKKRIRLLFTIVYMEEDLYDAGGDTILNNDQTLDDPELEEEADEQVSTPNTTTTTTAITGVNHVPRLLCLVQR